MTKRVLSFILVVFMCICSFSACNKSDETASSQDASSVSAEESSELSAESSVESETEEEKKMPEYWGFNDYETIKNPGAPEEIESYETTITKKPTAQTGGYISEYLFESNTDAGKFYTTFHETKWGTFNLGAMYLVDNDGKKHTFLNGYTDLEYVHQISDKETGGWVWSGGNHGNEALVSIDFYNGETGEKLELLDNEPKTVNVLHIIEKTKLLWIKGRDEGGVTSDISGYNADDIYAEVTRKYTVTGPQIKLNVDYKFTEKVAYFYRSYNCMFPIEKKYGLWCDLYNKDGKVINSIQTSVVGKDDYSTPANSGNQATRAVIYGYADPRYQFDIRVNTFKDSLDYHQGDYRVAYWDMNRDTNKLYFTKYKTNSSTAIMRGSEFHTECVWLFKFVEDAKLPEGFDLETAK